MCEMEKATKAKEEEWIDTLRKKMDARSPMILDTSTLDIASKLLSTAKSRKMFFPASCEFCEEKCDKATHINIVKNKETGKITNTKSCIDMNDEAATTLCVECLDKTFKDTKVMTCCICGMSAAILGPDAAKHMTDVYYGGCHKSLKVYVCDCCESENVRIFEKCECCENSEVIFVKHKDFPKVRICLRCMNENLSEAVEFINSELTCQ